MNQRPLKAGTPVRVRYALPANKLTLQGIRTLKAGAVTRSARRRVASNSLQPSPNANDLIAKIWYESDPVYDFSAIDTNRVG